MDTINIVKDSSTLLIQQDLSVDSNLIHQWSDDLLWTIATKTDTIGVSSYGFNGIPRMASGFYTDTNVAILFGLLAILSVVIAFGRKAKVHYFASIFKPNYELENTKVTAIEQWKHLLYGTFAIIGFAGLGVFTNSQYTIIDYSENNIWHIFGYLALFISLYFAAKYIVLRMYLFTFFTSIKKNAIKQYFSIIFYTGLIGFYVFIALVFTPNNIHYYVLFSYTIVVVLMVLLTFYVLYRTFFNKIDLIFYFILYLCTLEILPLLLLIKALSEGMQFITI